MRMIMVGKTGCLPSAAGNALAAFDVDGGGLDGFFHDDVADGLGDDLQDFQNRHAAAHQRGERAGEPGQADFVRDGAENGQLDALGVPEFAARLGFDVMKPAPDARTSQTSR